MSEVPGGHGEEVVKMESSEEQNVIEATETEVAAEEPVQGEPEAIEEEAQEDPAGNSEEADVDKSE